MATGRGDTLDKIIRDGDPREVVEAVTRAFTASDNARRPYEDKWRRCWRQYRSQLDAKKWPWQSNLSMPLSFSVVEAITPRLVAKTPKFVARPLDANVVDQAKAQEDWMNWVTSETVTEFKRKLRLGVKSSLIYGSGIFKTFYAYEERVSVRNMPTRANLWDTPDGVAAALDYGVPERRQVAETYTYRDNPDFANVSVFDFFPSPEALDIPNAEYCIVRSVVPRRTVEQFVEQGIYDQEVLDYLARWSQMDSSELPKRLLADEIGMFGDDSDSGLTQPVLVYELWAEPGLRATVINKAVLAQSDDAGRRNPFAHGQKPFVKFDDHEIDAQFWGISTLESVNSLQREIDSIRNERADNMRMSLAPQLMIRDGELDPRQLTWRPGGVVRINSMLPLPDIIAEVPRPHVDPASYQESQFLMNTLNEAVGLADYSRGADSPTRDTATEVNAKSEAVNARVALKQEAIDSCALKLMEQMLQNQRQFQTDPLNLPRTRVSSDDPNPFRTVTPEDFSMKVKIQVLPASEQETVQQRHMMATERLQLLTSNPAFLQIIGQDGTKQLIRDYLESEGVVNPDQYLTGEKEAQQAPPPQGMPPGVPSGPGGV